MAAMVHRSDTLSSQHSSRSARSGRSGRSNHTASSYHTASRSGGPPRPPPGAFLHPNHFNHPPSHHTPSASRTPSEFSEDQMTLTDGRSSVIDMPQFDPAGPQDNVSGRDSDSPSQDSGFSDVPNFTFLEKPEVTHKTLMIAKDIRTLCTLTDDFRHDSAKHSDQNNTNELLTELEVKIKPYLIRMDEEIGSYEDLVRKNIDRCKISEPKIEWLLLFHGIMLEYRRMLATLTVQVFEQMEQVLRLRLRGCRGINIENGLKVGITDHLEKIIRSLENIERTVHGI